MNTMPHYSTQLAPWHSSNTMCVYRPLCPLAWLHAQLRDKEMAAEMPHGHNTGDMLLNMFPETDMWGCCTAAMPYAFNHCAPTTHFAAIDRPAARPNTQVPYGYVTTRFSKPSTI
jgi:hypothetical protein